MQANQQSYIQAGNYGINGMQSLLGGDASGFKNSPYYNLGMEQAQYGIDHGAAARGSLYSGGHSLDLAQGLNNVFMNNIGQYTNGLQGLAGLGQASASNVGAAGMGMAGNIGNAYNNTANAQGTSYGAQATALSGLAGAVGSAFKPQNVSSYNANNDSLAPYYTNGAGGSNNTFWGYG